MLRGTLAAGLLTAVLGLAQAQPRGDESSVGPPNKPDHAASENRPQKGTEEHGIFEAIGEFWGKTTEDPVAFFTLVLSIVTAGLAVTALVQIRFLIRADRNTVRQLDLAERNAAAAESASVASRRAWVSIGDVKLLGPMRFAEDSVTFRLSVTMKNHGLTPATSLDVEIESYYPEGNPETFSAAENRFKTKLRTRPRELGHVLFPTEDVAQSIAWADRGEKFKSAVTTRPSGDRMFGFTIFIGVSYRIVGDEAAHITWHPHAMLNVAMGAVIQSGDTIDLPRMSFHGGEAD